MAAEILKKELECKKEEIEVLENKESGEPSDLRILQDKLVSANMEHDKPNKILKKRVKEGDTWRTLSEGNGERGQTEAEERVKFPLFFLGQATSRGLT